MTRQKAVDKNLQNVVKELEIEAVNSHQAQQMQQDSNDRRHQDALNHESAHSVNALHRIGGGSNND